MSVCFPDQLAIARYRFDFKIIKPIELNEYSGSALRGAFGAALKRVACMTRESDCKACPLYRSCPYPAIFSTPAPKEHSLQKFSDIPNPYVIEPPPWGRQIFEAGELFSFHMVLIGGTINHLALIVYAWKKAFEREVARGTAELYDVHFCPQGEESFSILDVNHLVEHEALIELPDFGVGPAVIQIETPLRLQNNSTVLTPETINTPALLSNLMRRVSLLCEFHLGLDLDLDFSNLRQESEDIRSTKQLMWLDWKRYSTRQKQYMKLGGVIGEWELEELNDFWKRLLYIAQWTHLGKNATFGLGKIVLRTQR